LAPWRFIICHSQQSVVEGAAGEDLGFAFGYQDSVLQPDAAAAPNARHPYQRLKRVTASGYMLRLSLSAIVLVTCLANS
jgi:hypothetical protein